jgi:hypothetical protein
MVSLTQNSYFFTEEAWFRFSISLLKTVGIGAQTFEVPLLS